MSITYDGFHLKPQATDNAGEHWKTYFYIRDKCKVGKFSELEELVPHMKRNSGYFFWRATTDLIGYSGSWNQISSVFKAFNSRIDDKDFQYFFASALGASCNVSAVQLLLQLHRSADDEESRHQVENHLSFLLEEEDGPVWDGADQHLEFPDENDVPYRLVVDREPYFEIVKNALANLAHTQASGPTPVYNGAVLDISFLSRRLHERLLVDDPQLGRINRERFAFEAATGRDTRGFYNENGTLLRLAAAGIIEDYFESDEASRFRPGQRYFFGHPIPL